jgi:hypothetical protein
MDIEKFKCYQQSVGFYNIVLGEQSKYRVKKIAITFIKKSERCNSDILIDSWHFEDSISGTVIKFEELPDELLRYIRDPFFEIEVARKFPEIVWL